MKVFLINLDKNTERLVLIDSQLKRLGIDYERFPAIYGKSLSALERHQVYDEQWAKRLTGQSLLDGEIGCALSHIRLYERIVHEQLPYALILEDDAYPTPALKPVLAAIEKTLSSDIPGVVLLGEGGHLALPRQRTFLPFSVYAMDVATGGIRTHAYVLTLAAAQRLVKFLLPIVAPADCWARLVRYGVIKLYCIEPLVVALDCSEGTGTTISENFGALPKKRSLIGKFRKRLWRLYWKLYDELRAWGERWKNQH